MAKLYFKFGSMGSSKTAQALMTRFNYAEKGKVVWLIKPDTDNRDDIYDQNGLRVGMIRSRIGLCENANIIENHQNIYKRFSSIIQKETVDVIIADEAQFFTKEQILQLRNIVSDYNIPVFCFGLRTDFHAKLFEGSEALFALADSISEIKSICKCGNKAIINARIDNSGNVVSKGNQIEIGTQYVGMCYDCWKKALNNI